MLGKKPNHRRWLTLEERAEQALKPGAVPNAPDLILLIHEVNPSGRELNGEVERRRYRLKSRLQSLLISRFREQVEVVPVPESRDVVSLRYRPQNRDACHAVVEELEEQARAYVRLALDLRAEVPASTHDAQPTASSAPARRRVVQTKPAPSTPRALLKAGHAALAAYEFDGAREYFLEALRSCAPGAESVEAASACLDLLVDRLAAYGEAAQLEAELSDDALADPGVRSTLALAQAHLGRSTEASGLLERISGDRAAEALIVLARNALARGDAKDAERWIADARNAAPSHANVVAASEELRRFLAGSCRPLEEELERQFQGGDEIGSEQKARQLLQTFGESATARRVLREIEGRRKARAAEARRAVAEEAFARGEYGKASALFREADALGSKGLADRISAADELERRRQERAQTEETLRVLGRPPDANALRAYFSKPERVRSVVRECTKLEELSWLEELQPKDEKQVRACAEAIVAFRRALAANAEGEPQALEELELHEPILSRLRPSRQWMARVRSAQEEKRSANAQERLFAARAMLAASNPNGVLQLLSPQNVREFPERLRMEAHELIQRARDAEEEARGGERFEHLVASGEHGEAVALCRGHLAKESQRPVWLERMGRVRALLRREFRIQTVEGCFGLDPGFVSDLFKSKGQGALSANAERLYLVSVIGLRVFIRVMEVATGQVCTLVTLKAPEKLESLDAHVDHNLLRMVGGKEANLELSLSSWDVERWIPGGKRNQTGEDDGDAQLAPLTNFLWRHAESTNKDWRLEVRDLLRERPVREVATGRFPWELSFIPSPGTVRMFASDGDDADLYEPSGAHVARLPFGTRCLAIAPEGPGWIASLEDEEEGMQGELRLALIGPDGGQRSMIAVEHSRAESVHHLATSLNEKRTFLVFEDRWRNPWLAAFELCNGALKQSYQVAIANDCLLAQDLASRAVVLLAVGEQVSNLRVLGTAPPSFDCGKVWRRQDLVGSVHLFFCHPRRKELEAPVKDIVNQARQGPPNARQSIVRSFMETHGEDDRALIEFSEALEDVQLYDEAGQVQAAVWTRFPDRPLSRLTRADACGRRRMDWPQVLPLLEGLSPEEFEANRRMHFHHLRGAAYLFSKRAPEALTELMAAAAVREGRCDLAGWLELTRALADEDAKKLVRSAAGELVERIRLADKGIAQTAPDKVVEALDVAWTWKAKHIQALARLAWAVLERKPSTGDARFRARLVLACYLEALKDPLREPPLANLEWEQSKLETLAEKARNWLQAEVNSL